MIGNRSSTISTIFLKYPILNISFIYRQIILTLFTKLLFITFDFKVTFKSKKKLTNLTYLSRVFIHTHIIAAKLAWMIERILGGLTISTRKNRLVHTIKVKDETPLKISKYVRFFSMTISID